MIEAVFERKMDRSAMASGAYQYDTGQRLRMHGLPSPEELACADALLSGEIVTMQVHFGWKGDSQTQARLALWEEDTQCWVAMIPDEYLQTAENVHAYIYVSYGSDEAGNGRTKTMYELVLRPIARPAPNNIMTSEQWEAWTVKKAEIQLTVDALNAAQENADMAQQRAEVAAQQTTQVVQQALESRETALEQKQKLDAMQAYWSGLVVKVVSLEAGAPAEADIHEGVLTYGLPMGAEGEKGDMGDTGPADIALSMEEGVLTITPRS